MTDLITVLTSCTILGLLILGYLYKQSMESKGEETEQGVIQETTEVTGEEVDPYEDISEPVISLVECIKSNPKRFSVSKTKYDHCYGIDYYWFLVRDKFSDKTFNIRKRSEFFFGEWYDEYSIDLKWTTPQEEGLLGKTLLETYQARIDAVEARKAEWEAQRNERERNAWKEIYCKGEE